MYWENCFVVRLVSGTLVAKDPGTNCLYCTTEDNALSSKNEYKRFRMGTKIFQGSIEFESELDLHLFHWYLIWITQEIVFLFFFFFFALIIERKPSIKLLIPVLFTCIAREGRKTEKKMLCYAFYETWTSICYSSQLSWTLCGVFTCIT